MTHTEPDEIDRPILEDAAEVDLRESDEDVEDGPAGTNELGPLGQLIVALVAVALVLVIIVGIGAVLSRLLG